MKSNPLLSPSTTSPLADLLVKEFRTCQDLHYLIREERRAVLNHDERLVDALTTQKQRLLEELHQLDSSVQQKIRDIGQAMAIRENPDSPSTTAKILVEYDRETFGRHYSLYEGILALKEIISAMDSVNQTLAVSIPSNQPQFLP
jgi:flagellar biosynthesis/type III secretory pathway chaperone